MAKQNNSNNKSSNNQCANQLAVSANEIALVESAKRVLLRRAYNAKVEEQSVYAINRDGEIVEIFLRDLTFAPTYHPEGPMDARLVAEGYPTGYLVWDVDGAKVVFRNGIFISDLRFFEFKVTQTNASVANARKDKADKPQKMQFAF